MLSSVIELRVVNAFNPLYRFWWITRIEKKERSIAPVAVTGR